MASSDTYAIRTEGLAKVMEVPHAVIGDALGKGSSLDLEALMEISRPDWLAYGLRRRKLAWGYREQLIRFGLKTSVGLDRLCGVE